MRDPPDGKAKTLTEIAWRAVFNQFGLDETLTREGIASVTAADIKSASGREPRLMTYFDTRESRPDRLKRVPVTILPVENGRYALLVGDGYANLPTAPPQMVSPQLAQGILFETLPDVLSTESQVIDVAHTRGILEHFFEEKRIHQTTRGRSGSGIFSFHFRGVTKRLALTADGVQVEVDGGYEGARGFYVIEAKMGLRENFHIRQLFYPVKQWLTKGLKKAIIPIFMCYSNQQAYIYQYAFDDVDDYHSLRVIKSAVYALGPERAPATTLAQVLSRVKPVVEPDVPFPQADDIRRVIDVVDGVARGVATKDAITEYYDFAERQASYYADAARYLGFLDRVPRGPYLLTTLGHRLVGEMPAHRALTIAEALATYPTTRAALEILSKRELIRREIQELIASSRTELTGSTIPRRAETIYQWLRWLAEHVPR